jgi:hypothetical protein
MSNRLQHTLTCVTALALAACGGEAAAPARVTQDAAAVSPDALPADTDATGDTPDAVAGGDATPLPPDANAGPTDAFVPPDPDHPCRAPAAAFTGPMFEEIPLPPDVAAASTGFGRVMVVDVNGDGFDDVVGTPAHDGQHAEPPGDYDKRVFLSHGDGTLTEFSAESGLAEAQVGLLLFGDVDNDGDADAIGGVIAGQGLDARGYWENDGAGHFAHRGEFGLVQESLGCGENTCRPQEIAGTLADFDADGLLDLYLGGWFWSDGVSDTRYSPPPLDRLFQGHGAEPFTDSTAGLGVQIDPRTGDNERLGRAAMGVAAGDYDNDADLDVFVANYGAGRPRGPFADRVLCEPPHYWDQDLLWQNQGGLRFTNVAEAAGVNATTRGPSGILEEPPLVIGDECPEEVRGSFPGPISGNSFTPQFADFDNDGDLDLIVGAISHPDYEQTDPTLLFVNQGPPDFHFTEEGKARGLQFREDEKHVHWVDLDRDGWLDLVATGFRDPATNGLRIYRQDPQTHGFTLLDAAQAGVDNAHQESVAFLDIDADGDLDLYLAEDDGPARLYRNLAGDANRGITLRVSATAPRDATGARVTVETTAGTLMRDVQGPQGHYNVQPSRAVYLGLGGDVCALGVTVRWPDGQTQNLGDLSAGADLIVEQGMPPRPRMP